MLENKILTALILDVRFSAEDACSVLATDALESMTSLRLGVELLLRLVSTPTCDSKHHVKSYTFTSSGTTI